MDFDYTQNFIDEVKGALKRPSGDGGGTTDYDSLENKPSINNVPLTGNKNTVDLNLTDETLSEEGVPADSKIVGQKLDEKVSYEEGTFSPYIMNGSINPSTIEAEYKKIGPIVYIAIEFSFSSPTDITSIGAILGLPFDVKSPNATNGMYPLSYKTTNSDYCGLASFENYMNDTPCIMGTNLFTDQETKVVQLYGQYETYK